MPCSPWSGITGISAVAAPDGLAATGGQTRSPWIEVALLLALCWICFWYKLGGAGLFDFNEGLYVQAARELALRGDWVVPSVNGLRFFDKPPLALWQDAIAFRLFGYTEAVARGPVALAATLWTFLTWWFGRRHFGARVGLAAAAILALSPVAIGTARQMTMDIHQSLWFAAALGCFFAGYGRRGRASLGWMLGFWASCGLSYLAKSIPGLFPAAVAVLFIAVESRFRPREILRGIQAMAPVPGILLLAAILAPWHWAAYRAEGRAFYEEYWVLHHVGLLTAKEFNHSQPFWYYVPALIGSMFPFGLALPPAAWMGLRGLRTPAAAPPAADRATRFVAVWFAVVFVIFSIMKSKLVSYLLPAYPAAALLIAIWVVRCLESRRTLGIKGLLGGTALLLAAAAGVGLAQLARAQAQATDPEAVSALTPAMVSFARAAVITLAAGASAAALVGLRRPVHGALGMVATMLAFVTVTWSTGLPAYQAAINEPLHRMVAAAGHKVGQGYPLAIRIGRPRRPSVFFYLPPGLFATRRNGADVQCVLESYEEAPIRAFLSRHPVAYVLAEDRLAMPLMADTPGLRIEQGTGRWRLLRWDRP